LQATVAKLTKKFDKLKEQTHEHETAQARSEATVANMTREVDRLKEETADVVTQAEEQDAKEDQLRDLAQKGGHFGLAYLLLCVLFAFGPTAAFLYKEDWAVGLTAASGSTDERPLLEDACAVRVAEAGEATGGAEACSDGQELAEVLGKAGAVDQAHPQRSMCNRVLWGFLKGFLALIFALFGAIGAGVSLWELHSFRSLPDIVRIVGCIFTAVLSFAVGWSFGTACEAAEDPPVIAPLIPTEGSWHFSVLCLFRLTGTERRGGCCTAWSFINACFTFLLSLFLSIYVGMLVYSEWVRDGQLHNLFGSVNHTCHAMSLLQHWSFAINLRKHCSPPPPSLDISREVLRVVCLCGLASGAGICECWLTCPDDIGAKVAAIVFNLSMLPSSLTCIVLLEGELLPLMEVVDRLTRMKEGLSVECKDLESRIRSLNNRWNWCLSFHSIMGGVTMLAGALSYFFSVQAKHQDDAEGAVALSVAPLFGMFLFLQVASVASYNTKVSKLGMATNDSDLVRLVNQQRLNFKILGKTLDLTYFKTLAATCAVSLTTAWVKSLRLV